MANAIERRLSALEGEASAFDRSLDVLFLETGESEAEALRREGYEPGSKDVLCVRFVSPRARAIE